MADELYVSRLVSAGVIPKAVEHARFALDRGGVERVSLERYRPGQTHPNWSTSREVATLLSVSRTRVNQLVRKGFLPAVTHPSGRYPFRRHQVEVIANARDSRTRR